MYSLVNSKFNRTYNPSKQSAICDIKRLLTSRDTDAQAKACGCLIEVISRYQDNSEERIRLVQYLLDSDITVFLCEVTCSLDFNLFRSVLQCIRLLWCDRFYAEEHAAHAMSAVVRAITHFSAVNPATLDPCLHFLSDLFYGIRTHKTASPLSYQTSYSTDQLFACFDVIACRINNNSKAVLSSALVLHELIAYQPENLVVPSSLAKGLVEILQKWLQILMVAVNNNSLTGSKDEVAMLLIVTCRIVMNSKGIIKIFEQPKAPSDFVNKILIDNQESDKLLKYATDIRQTLLGTVAEMVVFVMDNIQTIGTEEYSTFMKLVLNFYYESDSKTLFDVSDIFLSKGYLATLPKIYIERKDPILRKISTLVLGEILKVLSVKYLCPEDSDSTETICAKDIHMGLKELQIAIENLQSIGILLRKSQPYSVIIYIYFNSQASENPETTTASMLPYLVEYILQLPKDLKPPSYIIKAMWLVFAMSTISNASLMSLNERVYLEKACERLVSMLQPNPALYYTHNPALMFWAFTSMRISNYIRMVVLSQWLKIETSLPEDLLKETATWELLLNILIQVKDKDIVSNCMKTLSSCIEAGDDGFKENFGVLIWTMLPRVLSKCLIEYEDGIDSNICHLLDIATFLPPNTLEPDLCQKIAILITTLYTKNIGETDLETKYHYHYVCLNLSLLLLQYSSEVQDTKVLLTFTTKPTFLANVLTSTNSLHEEVACTALSLLANLVHYFHKRGYQTKSHLQIKTDLLVRSLRQDSSSERTSFLLQLIYTILSSGVNTPLVLTYCMEIPSEEQYYNALRALMFRIQITLCYRDSENRSTVGWKTLTIIFKHAIEYKNDAKLVELLTCQPWMYTLIRFQATQENNNEFLNFLKNWLSLFKISIKRSRDVRKTVISKNSIITRTMFLLKKTFFENEDVTKIVQEIQQECSSRK